MSTTQREPTTLDEAIDKYANEHWHEHDDSVKPSEPAYDLAEHIFETMLALNRTSMALYRGARR